jgi:hypothetical protein
MGTQHPRPHRSGAHHASHHRRHAIAHKARDLQRMRTDRLREGCIIGSFCLRVGDRCLSRFLQTDGSGRDQLFIFENGAWTRNTEEENPCPAGGTSHTRLTAVFPMPNPAPDPIVQLTGGGLSTVTGSACTGGHYDEVFTRTGDDPIPR